MSALSAEQSGSACLAITRLNRKGDHKMETFYLLMSQRNDACGLSLLIMHYIRLSTLSLRSNIYFSLLNRHATTSTSLESNQDPSRSSVEPPSNLAGAVLALLLRSSALLAISTAANCRLTRSGELVTMPVVDRRSSWPSSVRTSKNRLSILRTRLFPRWPSSKDRSRTCLRGLKFLFCAGEISISIHASSLNLFRVKFIMDEQMGEQGKRNLITS